MRISFARRLPWLLCLLCLAALLLAWLGPDTRPQYRPHLQFVGDIARTATYSSLDELAALQEVRLEGVRYRAAPLAGLIQDLQPYGSLERILLIAEDGFSAELAGDSLEQAYLTYDPANGWRTVCPAHPISANATRLSRIVVVATDCDSQNITVLAPGFSHSTSVGSLYAGPYGSYPYREGQAEVKNAGQAYRSTVYTRRDVIGRAQLGVVQDEPLLIYNAEGKSLVLEAESGFFQLTANRLDYIDEKTRSQLADIRLIAAQAPIARLHDIYDHAQHYLAAEEEVLLIFVTGLSKVANQPDRYLYLAENFIATPAAAVYPLTVEAWKQAVLLGLEPDSAQPLTGMRQAALDFEPSGFDGQLRRLCDGFPGAVFLAPLPEVQQALHYEYFCQPYYLRPPQTGS